MTGSIAANRATEFEPYIGISRDAARGRADNLLASLHALEVEPSRVAQTLRRHQLGGMAIGVLRRSGTADPLVDGLEDALKGLQRSGPVAARIHLAAFDEIQVALTSTGIPVVMLKGAGLAVGLYGGLDHRPQHDIDVLVARDDRRRAGRVLARLGYRPQSRDPHSRTFLRGVIKVDLHHTLRAAPAYRIDEDALWMATAVREIVEVPIRMLADLDTLTLLAASLAEDVGYGMAKLRSLCDIWLLTKALDATTDWEGWFAARSAENLEAVVANGCAIALTVLGTGDDSPRLAAALDRRAGLIATSDRTVCLELVNAERGSLDNMAWFASIYPGSQLMLQFQSFALGLPRSLIYLHPNRAHNHLRLIRSRRANEERGSASDI